MRIVGRLILCVMSLFCLVESARAEFYVAGQVGVNIPYNLSSVDWDLGAVRLRSNDLALTESLMYGAKFGYFFDSIKWLGVETEVFNATPHIKQQNFVIDGINFGSMEGTHNRVLTWAPINLLVRYQAGALEPYAGVGLGVFFSRLSADGFSSSSTDVGLNTQVGLRYKVTEHVAVFGEWKFNRARISHTHLLGTGVNVSADYNAHNFVFGVGYHF